ncbi:MAG: hypothetical protein BMS9Abin31_0147 [Gammaproteobacteria bacterium]|nr:MAG: hypothetical protein BMS9Abin31_0147 [Gammaproteobacteria bacterium]
MIKKILYTLVILYFGVALYGNAHASSHYDTKIIRVIDGDTVELAADVWLGLTKNLDKKQQVDAVYLSNSTLSTSSVITL